MTWICHWGLASDGNLGLCGSAEGVRRTVIRLVNCQYCQNIIDKWLSDAVVARKGEQPMLGEKA